MADLIKLMREMASREGSLLEDNAKDVVESNKKMLNLMALLGSICLSVLSALSMVLELTLEEKLAYLINAVAFILLYLLFKNVTVRSDVLMGMFMVGCMYLALTMHITLVGSSTSLSASAIGLLCLTPLIVLEKSKWINLMTMFFAATHVALSFAIKPKEIAISDTINFAIFSMLGLTLGKYMRDMRLENFEMKRQANIRQYVDFLTGLNNRRKLFKDLSRFEQSGNSSGGVLMIDIDKFKKYNDCYGHLAGDKCLSILGECFRRFASDYGIKLYRYGGEEFVGLSMQTGAALIKSAWELRDRVKALDIPFEERRQGHVTISIGVAVQNKSGSNSCEKLIGMADEALYKAKANGRDTVELFPSDINKDEASASLLKRAQ